MKDIIEWIENKGDFDRGYALLERECRNKHLLRTILRRRDMERLTYELEKLAKITEPVKQHTPQKAVPTTQTESAPSDDRLKIIDGRIHREDLPGPIRKLYDKAVGCYRRMQTYHAKMKVVLTDQERAKARAELCAADKERRKAWEEVDRWAEDGTTPKDDDDTSNSDIPDYKDVQAATTYLSRNVKKLDKTEDSAELEALKEAIRSKIEIYQKVGRKVSSKHTKTLTRHGILS